MEKGEGRGHTEVLVREMPLVPQRATSAAKGRGPPGLCWRGPGCSGRAVAMRLGGGGRHRGTRRDAGGFRSVLSC